MDFKTTKIILALFLFLFLGFSQTGVSAQTDELTLYSFYSPTCPHCAEEKVFLEKLQEDYSQLNIKYLDITDAENRRILEDLYSDYQVPNQFWSLVPIIFVGDEYILGYGGEETTGKKIESIVADLLKEDSSADGEEGEEPGGGEEGEGDEEEESYPGDITSEVQLDKLKIPLIGEIDASSFSPLALAVVLGTLDGFNACAMVALGFLLTILVATGVRKRLIIIGGTFILVSGIVYFLFITAWLNLFFLLGTVKYITIVVAFIIILFALLLLKDYYYGVVCKLCQIKPGDKNILTKIEKGFFKKMERIVSADLPLPLLLGGVIFVAAGINTIELFCSFGFPLVFTKFLSTLSLSSASYYFYIFIYVLFYMIDDLLIFLIAVWTLRVTQASEKYLKIIKLVSALVLLLLGLVMLLKPELLSLLG